MNLFSGLSLAGALSVAGMACLAAGMAHHHAMLGRRLPAAAGLRRWRCAGWLLLGLALLPCAAASGASVGVVFWIGLLSVGVFAVAGALSVRAGAGKRRR